MGNSDLWEGAPLRILALVWADPAVREACHELQALRRSLNLENDSDKRGRLVEAISLRERELLDRRAARELLGRVRRQLA